MDRKDINKVPGAAKIIHIKDTGRLKDIVFNIIYGL